MTLEKNNQVATLTNFGPAFKIHLKVKLNDFPTRAQEWSNILYVTNGAQDSTSGTRYPALYLNKDEFFTFNIWRNGRVYYAKYGHLDLNQDYDIIIAQNLIQGKWMVQVFVDGVLFKSIETTDPLEIEDAKVYFSDPYPAPADAEVKYVKIEY